MAQDGELTEKELLAKVGEPSSEDSSDAEHLLDVEGDDGQVSPSSDDTLQGVVACPIVGGQAGREMGTPDVTTDAIRPREMVDGATVTGEIVSDEPSEGPSNSEAPVAISDPGLSGTGIPPKFHRPRALLTKGQRITQTIDVDPDVERCVMTRFGRILPSESSRKRSKDVKGGTNPMRTLARSAAMDPAAIMKKPRVVVVDEGEMQRNQKIVTDYVAILNQDTRTIETQLLVKEVGCIPRYPLVSRMIMSEKSLTIVQKYREAMKIDVYRFTQGAAAIVDYGVVNSVDTIPRIWARSRNSPFEGISVTIHGTTVFPSLPVPPWRGLRLVYAGGSVSGPLPKGIRVLFLERFVKAVSVRWQEMLAPLVRLRILIVDSCDLVTRLASFISAMPSILAIVCLRGRHCTCFRSPIGTTYNRTVEVVPEEQNNNKVFNDSVLHHSGPRIKTRVKIYYSDDRVLRELCSAKLPAPVARAWARVQELRQQLADIAEV